MTNAVITEPKVSAEIAGRFAVATNVTYPDVEGDTPRTVTFYGSKHGGGVLMVIESTDGAPLTTRVDGPARFGEFGAKPIEWVRAFFAETESRS